ncbi:MAG: TerB family tellurite resistance protein [Myxococcota bacterium]|nr:TerB family tellurite resistance protein [Myxococcota bacterium]
MTKEFQFSREPEAHQVAFYGLLTTMANIDGFTSKDELSVMFEAINTDGLSAGAREQVLRYIVSNPNPYDMLEVLQNASLELRFGVFMQLVEVALADDVIVKAERELMYRAATFLGITEDQRRKMEDFVLEARRVRERGVDDDAATEAMQQAASGLAAVGVPLAAVYFSGSAIGLSAAGITSGLAALGFGLGMLPGIGMAFFLGTATFVGVQYLWNHRNRNRENQNNVVKEKNGQRIKNNLQDTIQILLERISALQNATIDPGENDDARREQLKRLHHRFRLLQQLLAIHIDVPADQ